MECRGWGILLVLQVVQFLMGGLTLASGSFILYQINRLDAGSATLHSYFGDTSDPEVLQNALAGLDDATKTTISQNMEGLRRVLAPVLEELDVTWTLTIVIVLCGSWAVIATLSHFSIQKATATKIIAKGKIVRLLLDIVTLLLWTAGLICAIMIALPTKPIWRWAPVTRETISALQDALRVVLSKLLKKSATDPQLIKSLSVFDAFLQISIASKLVAMACIIGTVNATAFFIIARCCDRGRKDSSFEIHRSERTRVPSSSLPYKSVATHAPEDSMNVALIPPPLVPRKDAIRPALQISTPSHLHQSRQYYFEQEQQHQQQPPPPPHPAVPQYQPYNLRPYNPARYVPYRSYHSSHVYYPVLQAG